MGEGLRRAFDRLWTASRRRNTIPGRLGKPDGDGTYTVRVTDRPGHAYVRLGPEGTQGVTTALNLGVPYRANLPVEMQRFSNLGPLVITGIDPGGGRLEHFAGGSENTFSTAPHTHRIGSGLEYELEALRMEMGRVRPSSGMIVYITPFRYQKVDGSWDHWPGDLLDLTAYKPATVSTWAWVLVGVDPDSNTSVAVTGTEYSLATPLTNDLIDDITFSNTYIPCGAVRVKQNDTSLTPISRYADAHVWFSVGASGTGEMFFPVASGWPSTTNGCADPVKVEFATNDIDLYVADFDRTSIEYFQWSVWMPDNWNAGTVTFKAVWTSAGGSAAQTVEWNLQGISYANDDAIDASWGAAVEVSDALITTGDIHYSTESSAVTIAGTPAAGELVQFRAWRNATNDNLDSDARLIGYKIYYTKA